MALKDAVGGHLDLLGSTRHDNPQTLADFHVNATYKRQLYLDLQEYFLKNFNNTRSLQQQEKLYDVPWTMITLLSVLYGSISLTALFGNGLVMWVVIVSRKMRTVTNYFIANLALADIIIGLFAIPFQFQAALLQRWHLPEFMCAFCPFIQVLSVNISVFTLSAIALNRYKHILYPLKPKLSKKTAVVIIVSIWMVGLLAAAPTQWDYKVLIFSHPFKPDHPYCMNDGLDPTVRKYYFLSLVGLQYIIPLFIISVAYIRIGVRLWGTKVPGNKEESRDAIVLQSKKKAIKMLVVVVLLFGVCWFPLQLYNFLQYVQPSINDYTYINIIWFCSHWLAMSNSCYNPFIYSIYSDKFQREFSMKCGFIYRLCRCVGVTRHSALSHTTPNVARLPARNPEIDSRQLKSIENRVSIPSTFNKGFHSQQELSKETAL